MSIPSVDETYDKASELHWSRPRLGDSATLRHWAHSRELDVISDRDVQFVAVSLQEDRDSSTAPRVAGPASM